MYFYDSDEKWQFFEKVKMFEKKNNGQYVLLACVVSVDRYSAHLISNYNCQCFSQTLFTFLSPFCLIVYW